MWKRELAKPNLDFNERRRRDFQDRIYDDEFRLPDLRTPGFEAVVIQCGLPVQAHREHLPGVAVHGAGDVARNLSQHPRSRLACRARPLGASRVCEWLAAYISVAYDAQINYGRPGASARLAPIPPSTT